MHQLDSLTLVKKIAHRLRDFEWVKKTVLDEKNTDKELMFPFRWWGDLDLSSGYPALVLLFAELDLLYPDEKWDEAAHGVVLKIKEKLEEELPNRMSIFGGLSGICFALHRASRKRTRYQKLISALDQILLEHVNADYLEPLERSSPVPVHLYETIQGLSGIGSYLLYLPMFKDTVKEICIGLSRMSEDLSVGVKGWYVPCEFLLTEKDRVAFPKGIYNLGLSHGITGVLAFLSIARLNGVEVQKEAIHTFATWILSTRRGHYFWPDKIPFEGEDLRVRSLDAWCYGTAGVARTLYLAGRALEDKQLQETALESFESIFSRTQEEWNLPGPTFCHGIAGLLTITHLMADDTGSSFLVEKSRFLEEILLGYYNESYPFGFRDYQFCKGGRYAQIDKAGLLEGVVGILLSLLSTNSPARNWMSPFLINHRIDYV